MVLIAVALVCIVVLAVAVLFVTEVAFMYRDTYRQADAIGRKAAELLRKSEEEK